MISIEQIQSAQHKRALGWTWAQVAASLGCGPDGIRKAVKKHERGQLPKEPATISVAGSGSRVASILEGTDVDLTKFEVTRASLSDRVSRVWLSRIPEVNPLQAVATQALKDIRYWAANEYTPISPLEGVLNPHMIEVALPDIHIGKLAWGEETLDVYDTSIALSRLKEAAWDLIEQAQDRSHQYDMVLLPVGNDLMHIDTKHYTTTLGTLQDTDSRYQKLFREAHRSMSWLIGELLQSFRCRVHVPIIPGNHDQVGMFMLGEVLAAQFHAEPLVTIDNQAMTRKYFRYGKVLLGFTHGNEEKLSELPNIMADEQAQEWGDTWFREWHVGHRHNKQQRERITHDQFRTTGVRILPSLCGQDYWHFIKGYRNLPQAEAHVWHRERGHRATFTHTAPGKAW